MAGLVSRVCPGGTKYSAVDSLAMGDHNFGGTVDSVTDHAPVGAPVAWLTSRASAAKRKDV